MQPTGILLSQGYWHIAVAPQQEVMLTIFHELVHLSLAQFTLPTWLAEGLVAETTRSVIGQQDNRFASGNIDLHGIHWSEKDIQAFWSGDGFHSVKLSQQCYSLAQMLVRELRGKAGFIDFVRNAKRADIGEAGARWFLGEGLASALGHLLGQSDCPLALRNKR